MKANPDIMTERYEISKEQYRALPSELHRTVVDILLARKEWTLKNDGVPNPRPNNVRKVRR